MRHWGSKVNRLTGALNRRHLQTTQQNGPDVFFSITLHAVHHLRHHMLQWINNAPQTFLFAVLTFVSFCWPCDISLLAGSTSWWSNAKIAQVLIASSICFVTMDRRFSRSRRGGLQEALECALNCEDCGQIEGGLRTPKVEVLNDAMMKRPVKSLIMSAKIMTSIIITAILSPECCPLSE